MVASTPPVWGAPHNGAFGDTTALNRANHINQIFGTHGQTVVYHGSPLVTPAAIFNATQQNPWNQQLATTDVDQAFVQDGPNIGRIQLPILPVGQGADLLVSLWSDNGSGQVSELITQTYVPASFIYQSAGVAGLAGPSSSQPTTVLTANPLAAAQFTTFGLSLAVGGPYNYPAASFTGISAAPSTCFYNGPTNSYIFLVGGVSNDTALTSVYTIPFGTSGPPDPSQVQQPFPVANDGSSASVMAVDSSTGSPILINCGGGQSFEGATVANVYASQFDQNAGSLGAWSAQTALPQAMQNHTLVTYQGWVYVIGGRSNGTTTLNTVYVGQVENGQITAWNATTPLPQATSLSFAGVTPDGTIIIAGGTNASFSTTYTNTWIGKINATTGGITGWQAGPALPSAEYALNAQPFTNGFGWMEVGTGSFLPANQYGTNFNWEFAGLGGAAFPGYYDFQNGQVFAYVFDYNATEYAYIYVNAMPWLSVPLPTTGLTNGTTYHITLQQQGGDDGNYLYTMISAKGYSPTGPTVNTSNRGAYTWTAGTAHYAVPITVYNQVAPSSLIAGMPVHTWEDNGARISTIVSATTPDGQLLGVMEGTRQLTALNENQGFQFGTAPWTISGGTFQTSSAEFYEGGVALQVTPSGSAATVTLSSEMLACQPNQSVTASCWAWFTSAETSNFSMSVDWYELNGTYISTSTSYQSASAATWTRFTNSFSAPAGAYFWNLHPELQGTPAAAQVFYIGGAYGNYTYIGPMNATVTQVISPGAYPATTWPALGTTELA